MTAGFVAAQEQAGKAWLYSKPKRDDKNRVRDVRWGDYLNLQGKAEKGWHCISWGGETCYIPAEHVCNSRPLELIFLDVGQGDGCILVSPETGDDERIVIIDAGKADNMVRFVKWRFGKLAQAFDFHAAVLTHSDIDHFGGFQPLFDEKNVRFDRVYHNGLAERVSGDVFGASDASKKYLVELVAEHKEMKALFGSDEGIGRKAYAKLMHTALKSRRVKQIKMLSTLHGDAFEGLSFMPGFSPEAGRACTIEVLGPIPETLEDGTVALRWFAGRDKGKTKNGHSVMLKIAIGDLSILLGGDLNQPAEDYILRHYGGIGPEAKLSDAVVPASKRLAADIMKSCHHGSADVTDEFLRAVHPFAFVVSSGDEESYAHPRPELLGRLGKNGRGDSPFILCTEILRSTREEGRKEDFTKLHQLERKIESDSISAKDKAAAKAEREALESHIQRRNVGVYGAITMRTDGKRLEISYRLEKPRGKQLWHSYALTSQEGGWKIVEDKQKAAH